VKTLNEIVIPEDSQLEVSRSLIVMYELFEKEILSPNSVLYPSCGYDASPAKVFKNVTFVDAEEGNEGCIEELQKVELKAIKKDIRAYQPEQLHDLLILLNPAILSEWATPYLQQGGFVLSNNYHGNAVQLIKKPQRFKFIGGMDVDDRNIANIIRNTELFFNPVKNEKELEEFRPSYYQYLKGYFETIALNNPNYNSKRPFEDLWKEYRTLIREGMPSKKTAYLYIFQKK
jgi:hypothetical protein